MTGIPALRLPVLAVAVGAFASCGGPGESPSEQAEEPLRRIVNVEVERVVQRNFTQVVRLSGAAMAMRDVVISAEEAGVVRSIVRDKGQLVRAGQPMYQLDDAILRAQVQTAAAQADYSEEVWERRKRLYEQDSVGSELSYHEARYLAEQGRGALTALRERLARTTVTAPINGVLNDRLVEIGSMVSPGTPVARIVQTDTIRIMAGAPERLSLGLAVGAVASVAFDALPDSEFESRLTYVGAVLDPQSRTFPIELEMRNPGGLIKPGMIAEVTIVQQEIREALVVPQQALVTMEDEYVVFVVEGDRDEARASACTVAVSVAQGNEAVIGSGLNEGDRLVVVGQQGLTPGDRVRVVPRVAGAQVGDE